MASGIEDYYLAGPEAPGAWMGSLARAVGFDGHVAARELQLVLEGRSPRSGELLTRRPLRVPGFDVTFSAPKSVSVLFGIADHGVRTHVQRAHDLAVRDAFAYLEREAAMTRRGRDGRELVRGQDCSPRRFCTELHAPATPSCIRTSSSATSLVRRTALGHPGRKR